MMKTIDKLSAKKVLMLSLFLISSGQVDAANATDTGRTDAEKIAKAEKEESRAPIGCKNVGYEFDMKTLRLLSQSVGAKQSLYFLYNKRGESVTLYQMLGDESSRSMYLNHKIDAKQWAVLSTSEKKMKYICAIPDGKTPYGKIIDCADSLNVCEYDNVRYGMNNQGNYWLVNSNTRNGAVNAVVHYGIIPGV